MLSKSHQTLARLQEHLHSDSSPKPCLNVETSFPEPHIQRTHEAPADFDHAAHYAYAVLEGKEESSLSLYNLAKSFTQICPTIDTKSQDKPSGLPARILMGIGLNPDEKNLLKKVHLNEQQKRKGGRPKKDTFYAVIAALLHRHFFKSDAPHKFDRQLKKQTLTYYQNRWKKDETWDLILHILLD